MLDKKSAAYVENKAKEERGRFQLGLESPIGNSIFNILENRYSAYIFLYPLNSTKIAGFTRVSNDNLQVFINTSLPRSYQIFAAAHELFHLIEIKSHNNNDFILCNTDDVSQDSDNASTGLEELKANFFAASYLLPDIVVHDRFDYINENSINIADILFDIVKIQIEYEVPYKTIIKRLKELNIINDDSILKNLSEYESSILKFCKLLDNETYEKVYELENTSSRKYHTLNIPLTAVDVYKGGLLSYSKLSDIVEFYGKEVESFAIENREIQPIDFSLVGMGDDDDV